MKLLRLQFVVSVLALALGISGCSQKKPVLVAPQQPPMTAAPLPTPTPEAAPTPPPAEESSATQPATSTNQPAATKPKPKTAKHPVTKKSVPANSTNDKPANAEVAKNPPIKIHVGPDKPAPPVQSEGQISPVPTPSDVSQNQGSTEQLLQKAEANLNNLKRQLSKEEDAIKTQIREFIDQSRKATLEKDTLRAYNLAVKARLLSDDLARER
jgi:hypothetical protein